MEDASKTISVNPSYLKVSDAQGNGPRPRSGSTRRASGEQSQRKLAKKIKELMKSKTKRTPAAKDAQVFFASEASSSAGIDLGPLPEPGPKYGCLKNGTLPTYRQANKPTPTPSLSSDNVRDRERPLPEAGHTITEESVPAPNDPAPPVPNNLDPPVPNNPAPPVPDESAATVSSRQSTRRVKKRFGKRGKKIAVLINPARTRRAISSEIESLSEKKIEDVKKYLRGRHLIRTGGRPPQDVSRELFKNAVLAGDVVNTNGMALVSDFMDTSS